MERSERLFTSVSEEEKQAVRMEAARQGMTMSAFVRDAILEKVDVESETGNAMTEANDPRAATASQTD